jgi:four helix bundle protein
MENKNSLFNYKDLIVWQKAFHLCLGIYKVTSDFPRSELYGLVSQLRRAAVSVPSNIAEGHSRRHTKEFMSYLSISLGSCAELETQLLIANGLGYMQANAFQELSTGIVEIIKMLRALWRSLGAKT